MALAGCGERARLSVADGMGPAPVLPPPVKTAFPTLNIASAAAWPATSKPTPTRGTVVARFAEGLDHPRWLYVLPNGDVLVAETNAPTRPEDGKGLKAAIAKMFMQKAGAATPSANRITVLRDANGDGEAETRATFVEGLNSPFGMALVGSDLYVATTDALLRYRYNTGDLKLAGAATKVVDLPGGPLNHHWTKNVIASADGSRLYVTVGSNSNVAENGIEKEQDRAAIWEIDAATGDHRIFASGLRNPVGLAWEPESGALWTAVNERDELGSDLVPDYMTVVRAGGFYGWPYSYYGAHVDDRVQPPRPDLVAVAIVPDYALGPHTASLGLAAAKGNALPERFRSGMFVGQHGSWNREPRSGYQVIFVPFSAGRPSGSPLEVLTGFVSSDGKARGRPVGVAIAKDGALLVADDVGNIIWRLTGDSSASASR
ncbi:MAG: sorbosone dehydrogenase family protein [Casimicrobiaceae bacterium]